MKCPVCMETVTKKQPDVLPVVKPVDGRLETTYAHVKCLDEQREARTTVKRP